MSLRGRGPEGIRRKTLAEIAATGIVRESTSCLSRGGGMQAFDRSRAAADLNALFATVENSKHGNGGRRAHRRAERLQRAAARQAEQTDLTESFAAALNEIAAASDIEPGS